MLWWGLGTSWGGILTSSSSPVPSSRLIIQSWKGMPGTTMTWLRCHRWGGALPTPEVISVRSNISLPILAPSSISIILWFDTDCILIFELDLRSTMLSPRTVVDIFNKWLLFLALTVRLYGTKFSRAVNLQLSRSEGNYREQSENLNQSQTVWALHSASCYTLT